MLEADDAVQDRLDKQKAERAAKGEAYNKDYKPQATSEEKGTRRKEVIANIGTVTQSAG